MSRNKYQLDLPFAEDDEQVLYRFTPSEDEKGKPGQHWDVAQEYVVASDPNAVSGIVVYAKHRGGWLIYPAGSRTLVAKLVSERARLVGIAERQQEVLQGWEALAVKLLSQTISTERACEEIGQLTSEAKE